MLMEKILVHYHYVAEMPLSLRYTPLKRSFLLTPLRSGFVPLAPVGHALDCARPKGPGRAEPDKPEEESVT